MSLLTLKKEVNNFVNGTLLILESVMSYRNEEEQDMLLKIFNGEIGDGFTINRFQECFDYSFDDEVYSLTNLCEALLEDDFNGYQVDRDYFTVGGENILSFIVGLELSKKSLKNMTTLCREDAELKKYLINFAYDEKKHGEYSFKNIFKDKGVIEFEKAFRGWSRAFQKDIKEVIGKRKIEVIKKEAKEFLDSLEDKAV